MDKDGMEGRMARVKKGRKGGMKEQSNWNLRILSLMQFLVTKKGQFDLITNK